ncbi:hypothetical protein Skr01_11460 [Sphaerisporangium krabiense]|uniref:Uncharacterized protein n=1 Tax=Sphaerisporangium krabiense TaxID=763782 RepID=A0A7W9DVN4_9ACTN|nr:hypothetical protein [Sphaerisporangium krabiense]MBB5631645.1 hypothetical protein [Sphaerisporangium krabiense]GII61061.1 hypothetical protein Skr01_11460 [Sphaerisporangium krabiense]
MTGPRDNVPADGAARLLSVAAWLLPEGRGQWGPAMRAELAGIEPAPARWRFALGCLRVALTRPRLLGTAACALLTLGVIAAALVTTGGVAYGPLRDALVGLVVVLLVLAWLGRLRGPLGPAARAGTTRLLRAGGCALVGAAAVLVFAEFGAATGRVEERAWVGLPILTCVLGVSMTALLAVTSLRSAAPARALRIGGGCGAAAATAFTAPVLLWPPLPPSSGRALAALAGAALTAMLITARRPVDAGHEAEVPGSQGPGPEGSQVEDSGPEGGDQVLIAGLCAAVVAALAIFIVADGLLQFAASWVPHTSPANVAAAGRLANDRAGAEDPYFGLLALGALLATLLWALARRSPVPESLTPPPAGPDATTTA